MANSEYKTVKANVESEIEIRKSVFIASVSRAETADEAEGFVRAIKKRFPDATHNCYAYTAGVECPSVRFSDDGEPGGTAGQPMLEVLKKKGLSNVAVVVTRYFGGIKLGAGVLVSAYTESVAQAIEKAGVVTMVRCELYSVRADYSNFSRIDSALTRVGGVKREVVYSDVVEATYAVKEDLTEKFVCARSVRRARARLCPSPQEAFICPQTKRRLSDALFHFGLFSASLKSVTARRTL